MNIREFFTGKTIFLSGTTGFVGKVILEKIMRSLPEIKRIYVMVRPKKSVTIQERLEKEILSSEIFNFHFSKNPEMRQQILQKIKPIAGDLIIDKLGLS
jgi:thioester reductase-like protein